MIVISRFCRSNYNKCLINHISTTVTSRCKNPNDKTNEITETEKNGETDEVKKSEQKKASKKLFKLFEDDFSKEKSSEAVKKLNTLKMSDTPITKTVGVTQKVKSKSKSKRRPVYEAAKNAKSQLEYNLVQSVKKVADEFGGDVDKTDKELLNSVNKFLDFKPDPEEGIKEEMYSKQDETDQGHVEGKDVKVDYRNLEETERLKGILSDITKISVTKRKPGKKYPNPITLSDLLEKVEPLEIFHPDLKRDEGIKLEIWHQLERDELKYLVTSAPKNYYQELIKWTEEGKLWHFPINNEQGMHKEAKVDFTKHVFLEDHLEPWCPKSGPLRHFMELVCVGLSKNPYLTVKHKREHIYWFRDYFEEKKRILQELGALSGKKELENSKETDVKKETD